MPGVPEESTSSHLKSNALFCAYVSQSAKYEVSSLSRVFDAVTALADERAVVSCARSLNCLSGGCWPSGVLQGPLLLFTVGLVTYQYTVSK